MTDQGPIPKYSGYFLTVNVNRNLFDPQHTQLSWLVEIPENTAVGTVVLTITGYDNDTKVRTMLANVSCIDYARDIFLS